MRTCRWYGVSGHIFFLARRHTNDWCGQHHAFIYPVPRRTRKEHNWEVVADAWSVSAVCDTNSEVTTGTGDRVGVGTFWLWWRLFRTWKGKEEELGTLQLVIGVSPARLETPWEISGVLMYQKSACTAWLVLIHCDGVFYRFIESRYKCPIFQ